MTLKQQIIKDIQSVGIDTTRLRIRYYARSPYQKRRYKPEFVEQECWLYPLENCSTQVINGTTIKTFGTCVTESDWKNEAFRDMVMNELKG